jgi:hypothetical protein
MKIMAMQPEAPGKNVSAYRRNGALTNVAKSFFALVIVP